MSRRRQPSQFVEAGDQSLGVIGLEEQPAFAVRDQCRGTRTARTDHGTARCHGLDHREVEHIPAGRHKVSPGAGLEVANLLMRNRRLTQQAASHDIGKPPCHSVGCALMRLREWRVTTMPAHARQVRAGSQRFTNHFNAFPRLEPTHHHQLVAARAAGWTFRQTESRPDNAYLTCLETHPIGLVEFRRREPIASQWERRALDKLQQGIEHLAPGLGVALGNLAGAAMQLNHGRHLLKYHPRNEQQAPVAGLDGIGR